MLASGSGGNGSGAHLCAELFKAMAGVDIVHVPYRGAPEIITAVIGGSALCGFPTLSTAVPLVKGGKIRCIGVTGPKRNAALPDAPPAGETVQGFEVVSWFGIVAPAGMDPALVRRINAVFNKVLELPAVRTAISLCESPSKNARPSSRCGVTAFRSSISGP